MRVVVAPDSFKECASAAAVAQAIADGWRRVFPDAEYVLVPMADGGEGTVDALLAGGGERITVDVTGPFGEPVRASYGLIHGGETAVIEMAAASGLALVPPERRDPRLTTTRGTGELMRHAMERGARHIILGLGGSATNDGGAGMAQALGYSLLDKNGRELGPGGAALAALDRVDTANLIDEVALCTIAAACDVDNPLCGPKGASAVYGPQKGATPEMVRELDAALSHFAQVVQGAFLFTSANVVPWNEVPGSGAAGGLGFGLIAFTDVQLERGVEVVAAAAGLAEKVKGADVVITGEGRIDGQSIHGKTPVGVAQVARTAGVPVLAIAGSAGTGHEAVYDAGIDVVMPICPGPITLDEAMARGEALMRDTAERMARLWQVAARPREAGEGIR